jgi:hypothetical protein
VDGRADSNGLHPTQCEQVPPSPARASTPTCTRATLRVLTTKTGRATRCADRKGKSEPRSHCRFRLPVDVPGGDGLMPVMCRPTVLREGVNGAPLRFPAKHPARVTKCRCVCHSSRRAPFGVRGGRTGGWATAVEWAGRGPTVQCGTTRRLCHPEAIERSARTCGSVNHTARRAALGHHLPGPGPVCRIVAVQPSRLAPLHLQNPPVSA